MALSRENWAAAALAALVEDGVSGVAVQPLAERLGATKGSFYWHFGSRDELLDAALAQWEDQQTTDVIDLLGTIADANGRLARLIAESFADESGGLVDAALLGACGDARVAVVVERVTARRVDYLRRTFLELGFPAAKAERRAVLAYAAYVGTFQLRRVAPLGFTTTRQRRAYVDTVLASLLSA